MSRRGKRGGKRDDDGRRVRETSEERFLRASAVTYKHANIPSVVGIKSADETFDARKWAVTVPVKAVIVSDEKVNEYWDSLPKESR